jgi:hypothetical protein
MLHIASLEGDRINVLEAEVQALRNLLRSKDAQITQIKGDLEDTRRELWLLTKEPRRASRREKAHANS